MQSLWSWGLRHKFRRTVNYLEQFYYFENPKWRCRIPGHAILLKWNSRIRCFSVRFSPSQWSRYNYPILDLCLSVSLYVCLCRFLVCSTITFVRIKNWPIFVLIRTTLLKIKSCGFRPNLFEIEYFLCACAVYPFGYWILKFLPKSVDLIFCPTEISAVPKFVIISVLHPKFEFCRNAWKEATPLTISNNQVIITYVFILK